MPPLLQMSSNLTQVPLSEIGEQVAIERIRTCFADGNANFDLSDLALKELPEEINSISMFTTCGVDGVTNSVNLYFMGNALKVFPKSLFSLTNLTVLSLRGNLLKELPREIILLYNLRELSIGGNQLTFIPFEVEQLPKLQILSANPNPFLPDKTIQAPSALTLQEHALRAATKLKRKIGAIERIQTSILLTQQVHDQLAEECQCFVCAKPVFRTRHERLVNKPVLNSPSVTIRYLYCSLSCLDSLPVFL